MAPHTHQEGVKRFITHTVRLFGEGRVGLILVRSARVKEGMPGFGFHWDGEWGGVCTGRGWLGSLVPSPTKEAEPGFLLSLHGHGAEGGWGDRKAVSGQTHKIDIFLITRNT